MTLDEFVQRYPLREPRLKPANEDELKKLGQEEGVEYLSKPPANAKVQNIPTKKGDNGCHLWVFNEDGVPYILERTDEAACLKSGVVKHTNLTGGAMASCGGELWVDPTLPDKLYLNGCSGRYGPRTEHELEDAASVFENRGFDVVNFGWDEDANLPAVVLR